MKKTNYETKILSKNRNSAESGRSMVEMLGVLAIVGVISIGGIAGYNYGMNRYRTNELLDGANKRAYTIATQMTLGISTNLSEFKDYDATAGGTFQTTVQEWRDDGEFGIQVTGVKKEVCENILRMIGDNTPLRALSKGEVGSEEELKSGDCADGDTNAFSFVYNVEMLSKGAAASDGGNSDDVEELNTGDPCNKVGEKKCSGAKITECVDYEYCGTEYTCVDYGKTVGFENDNVWWGDEPCYRCHDKLMGPNEFYEEGCPCLSGETKCVDRKYQTCNDGSWKDNGYVVGKCGAECGSEDARIRVDGSNCYVEGCGGGKFVLMEYCISCVANPEYSKYGVDWVYGYEECP